MIQQTMLSIVKCFPGKYMPIYNVIFSELESCSIISSPTQISQLILLSTGI